MHKHTHTHTHTQTQIALSVSHKHTYTRTSHTYTHRSAKRWLMLRRPLHAGGVLWLTWLSSLRLLLCRCVRFGAYMYTCLPSVLRKNAH